LLNSCYYVNVPGKYRLSAGLFPSSSVYFVWFIFSCSVPCSGRRTKLDSCAVFKRTL